MAAAPTCSSSDPLGSLAETVAHLIQPGRGILAADESTSTVGKRLASVELPNTEDNRRALREMLFTAPGIEKYISGVILYEETLFQKGSDGRLLVQQLTDKGIALGIKVDIGVVPLPGSPGETITQGLDNLAARCERFHAAGARFAKWRAVINARGSELPTNAAVRANSHALARYAAVCQAAGLVPIVEPEVLAEGPHDAARCEQVTQKVLAQVFRDLHESGVQLEYMLLKPNMVTPGNSGPSATPAAVAEASLRVLRRTVPPAVPGIVFLSGGQSEQAATEHLALINRLPDAMVCSFSYGRALQASALKTWAGQHANVPAAQQIFIEHAKANSQAVLAA